MPKDGQDTDLSDQPGDTAGVDDFYPLQEPLAGGIFLQMDEATPADQAVPRNIGERGEDTDMDRGVGLPAGDYYHEAVRPGYIALHIDAGSFGNNIRKMPTQTTLSSGAPNPMMSCLPIN